jgi:predicted CopG family antitoxin
VASKNIGIKEDVYERLKAHKRGDESFSETLDRLLHELDADWRTNVGFLTDDDAAEFERVVAQGLDDTDESLGDLADEIDDRLQEES